MSREKQIEETAKELCGMNVACKDCRLDKLCLARNSADILYNAGYRKQSDLTPCDVCRFNPPSSGDGKPCTLCVADGRD